MIDNEIKFKMDALVEMIIKAHPGSCTHEHIKQYKQAIAKAVNLGMKYQEEKIKEGINIVFQELNK